MSRDWNSDWIIERCFRDMLKDNTCFYLENPLDVVDAQSYHTGSTRDMAGDTPVFVMRLRWEPVSRFIKDECIVRGKDNSLCGLINLLESDWF